MGRSITLADGAVFPSGECGYAEKMLWCYLPADQDLGEAFAAFTDPEKTKSITFTYGDSSDTYENQTDFRGLWIDADGKIKICLAKGD